MNYLIKPRKPFFISNKYSHLIPDEIRHFIVWVACQRPSTVYESGKTHCTVNCFRSIDDIYHLLSHKWQISEEEYLNILVELFSSPTKYTVQTIDHLNNFCEGVIYFRYCVNINRITAVFHKSRYKWNQLITMIPSVNSWYYSMLSEKTLQAWLFFKSKV